MQVGPPRTAAYFEGNTEDLATDCGVRNQASFDDDAL